MKCRKVLVLLVAVGSAIVAGCGRLAGGGDVAVVDLAAVAKATGQDTLMAQQVEAARQELATQLTQIAGTLEKQLQAEQSRLGGAVAASREKEFQQLTAQARQQLAETQALAQQKAQDYQIGLVASYRRALQPVVADIAGSKGAAVVLVSDATMLWFDPAVDITADVIAELRANPVAVPAPAGADPASEPAASDAGNPGTEKE
jgi:Skp family chaperone for outer membrane proteins